MTLMPLNTHWISLINEHRDWLAHFNPEHGAAWEKLLKKDVEAALCEAAFRRLLEEHKVEVTPNQTRSSSGRIPDFCCIKDEQVFYVDATCIKIETATKKTGIDYEPKHELRPFSTTAMTQLVQNECRSKASQFADLDAPGLLAIGSFHTIASMTYFRKELACDIFTGNTQLVRTVSLSTGQCVGEDFERTELHESAFLRPEESESIGYARSSISAILLCGFGSFPGQCIGLLHPNPRRPFIRSVLPGIEFGSLDIDLNTKQLIVFWA